MRRWSPVKGVFAGRSDAADAVGAENTCSFADQTPVFFSDMALIAVSFLLPGMYIG